MQSISYLPSSIQPESSIGSHVDSIGEREAFSFSCSVTSATPKLTFQSDLGLYLKKMRCSCNVSVEEAVSLIRQGALFLEKLRHGELDTCTREEKRAYIVPFIWHLFSKALEKKEGFLQGMFVFSDPDYQVASFFSSAASKRISTHYEKRSIGSHFGIDTEFGRYRGKMPNGFHTVLFGQLDAPGGGQWSFFKPEDHGLESFGEKVRHGVDYCWSRILRLLGREAGPYDRREDFPASLTGEVKALKRAGFTIPKKCLSTVGFSGLSQVMMPYAYCRDNLAFLTQDQRKALRKFLEKVLFSYDWLQVRLGAEVVICDEEDHLKGLFLRLLVWLKESL